jgi:hypothetical protein
MADCAKRIDIHAIDSADLGILRRKRLQVPSRWRIRLSKDFLRQEMRIWALESSCKDNDVTFDELFSSGTSWWDTLMTVRESDAHRFEGFNVAAEPAGLAGADLRQYLVIAHRGASK